MNTLAIAAIGAVVAAVVVFLVFRVMLGKIQKLTEKVAGLEASNIALQAELERALSRREIEAHVEKQTPAEREQSLGAGGSADNPNNPLAGLRDSTGPTG